ncbi:MHS family MFS transporter [Kibdelosporangium philippinense]|uniref:MHS family MFS transporter n=1 Tax=Kibdelosporangium philippinense TaxID=211113 RepID=A0ABS8Z9S9_9PSEU|nr:MFS transporter [Kibdelosporangium philippinense]MCE7003879.1 MHS family MFS transporter [Kibdelosporangium philippinense]
MGELATASRRKVALATLTGATLEWYDFFLYGTASALIFNRAFFPSLSPAAGTLAAFSTFAVGFIARPLGGLVFGHFGDRIGRKMTLVVSLMLMGIGSTLIGVLPGFATIGVWAPILLVALRVVQGVGLGGENAGANLIALEHAPDDKRNRYAGFPQMGTPAGLVLANTVFLITSATMSPAAFTSWGWRIPFLLSGALVIVGLIIRLRVTETPSFAKAVADKAIVRFPLKEALSVGVGRLVLTLLLLIASSAVAYLFMVFSLSYGTTQLGLNRQFLVLTVTGASVLWFLTIPLWTWLADRNGRRGLFLWGSLVTVVWAAAYFPMINTGNTAVVVTAMLGMGIIISITHCLQGAIVADTFPAHVRYSGSSLLLQLAALLGGGLAPVISTAILTSTGGTAGVSVYIAGVCTVSLLAAIAVFRLNPLPAKAVVSPAVA